jgi:hypothetical protein
MFRVLQQAVANLDVIRAERKNGFATVPLSEKVTIQAEISIQFQQLKTF